jgi:hypothetical protein
MIYLSQKEACIYMRISNPTFRKFRKAGLIPEPTKERKFTVKGRASSKTENLWSRNAIDNSTVRINKYKKEKSDKIKNSLIAATEKSKRAANNRRETKIQDVKIAEIFNSFMNIRIKTA